MTSVKILYGSISKQKKKMKIKLVLDINTSIENCFPHASHDWCTPQYLSFACIGIKVTIRIIRMIATFPRFLISLLQQKKTRCLSAGLDWMYYQLEWALKALLVICLACSVCFTVYFIFGLNKTLLRVGLHYKGLILVSISKG